MYSTIKNIQILLALMKEHGIDTVVVSPGGSSITIIHSMEDDPFFHLYSAIDERSAAYFAMGLAQELGRPVGLLCTSGTAVCNYLPAVTEAFYQKVPVLVITADKHPYFLNQLATQKINQENIFGDKVKKCVMLPMVNTEDDFWYCERLINEGILELTHHGCGPVHINIPTIGLNEYVDQLPYVRKVSRISKESGENVWESKAKELAKYKKIFVLVGQTAGFDQETTDMVSKFFEKYNCIISAEHLSNLNFNKKVNTYLITETHTSGAFSENFIPDLVISMGGNVASYNIKTYLCAHRNEINHWVINDNGSVCDAFKNLTTIFECSIRDFFSYFAENAPSGSVNDKTYYNSWVREIERLKLPELPYSTLGTAKMLSERIPQNSLLHLGILNSIRVMQFWEIPNVRKVYGNIGALGIDGTLSTFLGQAAVTDDLCFLVIGDFSFFYDMNAVWLRYVKNNVRIVLLNNLGAEEFYFFFGKENMPEIDNYIAATHNSTAKDWIQASGFDYIGVSNSDELSKAMDRFVSPSGKPILMEVMIDIDKDSALLKSIYSENKNMTSKEQRNFSAKQFIGKTFGNKTTNKLKKIVRAIRD